MDFYQIKERSPKKDSFEIYPDFLVCRSKDLMVRGKAFYAVWDEENGIWSTDEYDVQRMVDHDLYEYYDRVKSERDGKVTVKSMRAYSSNSWKEFKKYLTQVPDSNHTLDTKLAFSNSEIRPRNVSDTSSGVDGARELVILTESTISAISARAAG